ncbi:MAG: RING-type E3 ubiquitin-protein ligase ppil2 [Paramarteilia canceri]
MMKTDDTISIYSTGAAAASLTSTAVNLETKVEHAVLDADEAFYKLVKTNSFVQIVTNFGNLNCELFCKDRPKTCHNFIALALSKYYDKTIFHLLETDFIIQGGDPTGTGRHGESIWKTPFDDEHKPFISFNNAGCLGMASTGKNSNGSQFFITFKPLTQLNQKYTIFGKVVGGLDVLNSLNKIKVDEHSHPKQTISIATINIFNNPYYEAKQRLETLHHQEIQPDIIKTQDNVEEDNKKDESSKNSVGKYINIKKLPSELNKSIHDNDKSEKVKKSVDFTFDDW